MTVMKHGVYVVLGGAFLLTACGETKLLGSRAQPDETQVVDGPTLVLPPHYDLRPPRTGSDYESVLKQQSSNTARQLVTGQAESVAPAAGTTGTDAWLVQNSGRTDANIRETLDEERMAETAEKKAKAPFWKRWFSSDDAE